MTLPEGVQYLDTVYLGQQILK